MKSNLTFYTLIALTTASTTACGKKITLTSGAFPTSGATQTARVDNPAESGLVNASTTPTANVTDFKICVTRVSFQSDSTGEDKEEEFEPGLIDLSSGEVKTWGDMPIPSDFKLKRIRLKVHNDADLCGVDYSIKFNDTTTKQTANFKFTFGAETDVANTEQISVSLKEVVEKLRQAVDAGTISSLKERVEEADGAATATK